MKKAKFIGKWYGTGYERNTVYLEYEYRGMRYNITENMAKGNEPLSWQHKAEQARIDTILDTPVTNGATKPFELSDLDIFDWEWS